MFQTFYFIVFVGSVIQNIHILTSRYSYTNILKQFNGYSNVRSV